MKFLSAMLPCLLFLFVGCDGAPTIVAVKGVATRGGQPIKNLSLTFHPDGGGRSSTAVTDDQGRFELKYDKEKKGAVLGTHKVTAAFRPRSAKEEFAEGKIVYHPDQDAIIEKYGKLDTTPRSIEITKEETDLQLAFD